MTGAQAIQDNVVDKDLVMITTQASTSMPVNNSTLPVYCFPLPYCLLSFNCCSSPSFLCTLLGLFASSFANSFVTSMVIDREKCSNLVNILTCEWKRLNGRHCHLIALKGLPHMYFQLSLVWSVIMWWSWALLPFAMFRPAVSIFSMIGGSMYAVALIMFPQSLVSALPLPGTSWWGGSISLHQFKHYSTKLKQWKIYEKPKKVIPNMLC